MTAENLDRLKMALWRCGDQWVTAGYLAFHTNLYVQSVAYLLRPLVASGAVEKQPYPYAYSRTVRYRVRKSLD